jgi:hypothetical protein
MDDCTTSLSSIGNPDQEKKKLNKEISEVNGTIDQVDIL